FAIGRWSRFLIVGLGLLSFVGGIALVTTGVLSTEFFPDADNGELQVNVEMPAGTTLEVTNSATQKVEERILAWPEVKQVFTSIGVANSGGFGTNRARFSTIFVELKDKKERLRTPNQLGEQARTFNSDIPGLKITASNVSNFGPGGSSVAVRVVGEDSKVLAGLAGQVGDVIRK